MLERERGDEENVFRNMYQTTGPRKYLLIFYDCFGLRFSKGCSGKWQIKMDLSNIGWGG
jgi:hypothetical protein